MRNLRGKRVLITGGAQGIGRKLALCFAKEGAEILLMDIAKEALTATAAEISAMGVKTHAYFGDITDAHGIAELRDNIHAEVGKVDVLVNNAGVVFGGDFLNVPVASHLKTLEINIEGVVRMTHAFLPDLIGQSEGHLVNIASAAGLLGLPHGAAYSSSKWAVIGLSESLRLELRQLGHEHVKVTTVCPSYVDTGMFDGAKPPTMTPILDPGNVAQKVVRAVLRDKAFVMEPFLVKLVPLLKGCLPLALIDWIAWRLGVTSSMKSWRGKGGGA